MLAGISLAALQRTREAARMAHTKATIAKINDIIMQKYELYRTRRLPISFTGLAPKTAAALRMYAIRDLMRMEMPEGYVQDVSGDIGQSQVDVGSLAGVGSSLKLPEPALHRLYRLKMTFAPSDHQRAKCLYMIVTMGNPQNKALFSQDEIADVDGDGLLSFIDGWGRPISFFRWAPGFSQTLAGTPVAGGVACSDIQIADPINHHDPLDPRGVDSSAYQLFPLIFAGVIGKNGNGTDNYGISFGLYDNPSDPNNKPQGWLNPCQNDQSAGLVTSGFPITNHHMEQK
jgi:hypothetical protein